MIEPLWLRQDVVIAVHQLLITEHGGSFGLRDEGLLESALARPKQLFNYEESVSIFDLAAAYSFGIAKNHPFVDGNKRIALVVAGVFLDMNGYDLDATESEAVVAFTELAAGKITESGLAQWIKENSRKTLQRRPADAKPHSD
ncbi:MAG: type II toxin-antitoxin system death-on-curing family toxin [Candidatus Competibacterales bacterium]